MTALLVLAGAGSGAGLADGVVALLALLGLVIGVAVAGRWARRLRPDAVAPMDGRWRG